MTPITNPQSQTERGYFPDSARRDPPCRILEGFNKWMKYETLLDFDDLVKAGRAAEQEAEDFDKFHTNSQK